MLGVHVRARQTATSITDCRCRVGRPSNWIRGRDRPKHGGANLGASKTGDGNGMAGDDRVERRRWSDADPRSCPGRGGYTDPHSTLDPLGLTLNDGSMLPAGCSVTWSGPGRGVQRTAPPLLALSEPPPAEGYARTAVELGVWRDGTDGPRSLGEASSTGTVYHVLVPPCDVHPTRRSMRQRLAEQHPRRPPEQG